MSRASFIWEVTQYRRANSWQSSFRMCVTRLIHICDSCVTWLNEGARTHGGPRVVCVWHCRHANSWRSRCRILKCVPPWLVHVCAVTHSYVCDMTHSIWHESFVYDTHLLCVCHDSFTCVPCLIHMCDMNHSYVWHDSFICVTRLIHMCDMTHSYVWLTNSYGCHESIRCATWLVYMWEMAASYVWHD